MKNYFDINILLVDDSEIMRELSLACLKRSGFQRIIAVSHCVEALRALNVLDGEDTDEIDLIITDWNMPDITGLDLLFFIRNYYNRPNLPVIFITSENTQDKIKSAFNAGVNGYIIKPFLKNEIYKEIVRVMDICHE